MTDRHDTQQDGNNVKDVTRRKQRERHDNENDVKDVMMKTM